MTAILNESLLGEGNWPTDPQDDLPISKDRLWVDGCFDFAHHGHAGALLQAKRLGRELIVGVHSDEDIMQHKGPTVMTLQERIAAVDACRWSDRSIPYAPYVTSIPWISHYGCYYVVHGDDVTSDSNGEDCYRYVKEAGRFLVVKRTPSISTTDLVGRMLLCTKSHFIKSLPKVLNADEGSRDAEERRKVAADMKQRIQDYASDHTGLGPGCMVFAWSGVEAMAADDGVDMECIFKLMVDGQGPFLGQRVVYVDGGFDLFSSGHIEFLRQVIVREEALAQQNGWYNRHGRKRPPAYLVAGVHEDSVINQWKGVNYPIMNIYERGLCILQCRYVNSVIFSAPYTPSTTYLSSLPFGKPDAIYHGPTSFSPCTHDPYIDAKKLGIYQEIGNHDFQHVNAGQIVQRILQSRQMYEARQRAKGVKAVNEEAVLRREILGKEAVGLRTD